MSLRNSGPYGVPKQSPDEIYMVTGNGYGSTNTLIRRYTTIVKNSGQSITYKDDPVLGGSFVISVPGIYAIQCQDDSTAAAGFGVSINASAVECATAISVISVQSRVMWVFVDAGTFASVPGTCITYLNAGDIIRGHADTASAVTTAVDVNIRITRIS